MSRAPAVARTVRLFESYGVDQRVDRRYPIRRSSRIRSSSDRAGSLTT
jgi:hypothetical protein